MGFQLISSKLLISQYCCMHHLIDKNISVYLMGRLFVRHK